MNKKQLKDSILQYAIQGKLVPQDPNDESASELLKKIAEKKQKLIQDGVIKKEKPLEPITENEIPFDIPESWEWVRFNDAVLYSTDYVANGSFATLRNNVKTYKEENYALLVKTKDFASGFSRDLTYVDKASYDFLEKSRLFGGELMLSNIGASIGKAFIIPKLDIPMTLAPNSIMVKCIDDVMTNFIRYLILSFYGQRLLKDFTSGTAMPKFSKTQLRNCLLPIPPYEEQKRIVTKIKELLPYMDNYDKLYLEVDELNKNFPEEMQTSILQYAMQGKLVEQDSDDEPAQEVVKKIQIEKERLIKEKIIKKNPLSVIAEEEIPFDIPSNWEWVRLGEICEINPRNHAEDYIDVGFIPMKLIEDGNANKHTFEKRKWKDIKKGYTHFQENDIVVAKITPCFENRKSAIVNNLPNGIGAGTTELFVFRPYSEFIDREYLLWIFKSHNFISGGKNSFSGTAGQQRVSKSYIENYLIPLPPYKEQKRIVNKIFETFSVSMQLIK